MISPEKTKPLSCIALSKPSEGSIRSFSVRFFVNLCLIALGLSFGSVHCKLWLEYCSDCASPSSYLNVADSSPFITFVGDNFNIRKAYFRCLLFNNNIAGVKQASFINELIGDDFKAPVIALACLFIRVWISVAHVVCPRHHISAPYKVTDCTAAIWTLRISSGAKPKVENINFSLFSTFFIFYSRI